MVLAQVFQIYLHILYFNLTFVINMIPERAFKQTWFTLLKSIEHLLYWSILNRRHTEWFYAPIAANLIAAERLGDFFRRRQCGTSALTSGSIEWLLKIVWTNVNKQNGDSEAKKKMLAAALILQLQEAFWKAGQ